MPPGETEQKRGSRNTANFVLNIVLLVAISFRST